MPCTACSARAAPPWLCGWTPPSRTLSWRTPPSSPTRTCPLSFTHTRTCTCIMAAPYVRRVASPHLPPDPLHQPKQEHASPAPAPHEPARPHARLAPRLRAQVRALRPCIHVLPSLEHGHVTLPTCSHNRLIHTQPRRPPRRRALPRALPSFLVPAAATAAATTDGPDRTGGRVVAGVCRRRTRRAEGRGGHAISGFSAAAASQW